MAGDDGRIPVPYNVSIRNMGDGAVRIIGKNGPSVPTRTARRSLRG